MKGNVLISSRDNENTTDTVIMYLIFFGKSVVRNHSTNFFKEITISLGNSISDDFVDIKGSEKNVNSGFGSMWYRKGDFSYVFPFKEEDVNSVLGKCLKEEWRAVKLFLHDSLKSVGGFEEEYGDNKIVDLYRARNAGIEIPETVITTKKSVLENLITFHGKVLTKPIHNGHVSFSEGNKKYSSKGVVMLDQGSVSGIPNNFGLSIFQEYVDKDYELRIFFIKEELYPMAIFSQSDQKTKYDFRNYNREKPNRCVPFKLPEYVSRKIITFIQSSKLTTGSIDLIRAKDGRYVFLEVNPAGQFGWLSTNCNYYLEMRIAQFLANSL